MRKPGLDKYCISPLISEIHKLHDISCIHAWCKLISSYIGYGTARFKLEKNSRVNLHAALQEPKNIRCVSASAREGDDVPTTRGV